MSAFKDIDSSFDHEYQLDFAIELEFKESC